jgi:hypothetical protein
MATSLGGCGHRQRQRPHHRRLGALPQARPMARLFAAGAAALGRRAWPSTATVACSSTAA